MGRPRKGSAAISKTSQGKRRRPETDTDCSTDSDAGDKDIKQNHATAAQREKLLDEMEKNFQLFNGEYHSMAEEQQIARNKAWEKLAIELNSMEKDKAPKTRQQWLRTWKAMQTHAKKAVSAVKNDIDETGGGPGIGSRLTTRQERIISLIGPRATGILQRAANCSEVLSTARDHQYSNLSKIIHDRLQGNLEESDRQTVSVNSSDEDDFIATNPALNRVPPDIQPPKSKVPQPQRLLDSLNVDLMRDPFDNPIPGPSHGNFTSNLYANPTPGPSHVKCVPGPSHAIDVPGPSHVTGVPGLPQAAGVPGPSHTKKHSSSRNVQKRAFNKTQCSNTKFKSSYVPMPSNTKATQTPQSISPTKEVCQYFNYS
ncbi:uncharacterized protein LOC129810344 [Phlebotomus papatasi]|uniref:uncharacterized protein LOC129810344 n=1 Tax=Phlebotomus papatasi TaxID=29031 RepID=UPI0024838C2A|nr:uncharacterized protein LOC129810344 [Phlebotomus papatasi]